MFIKLTLPDGKIIPINVTRIFTFSEKRIHFPDYEFMDVKETKSQILELIEHATGREIFDYREYCEYRKSL